MPVEETKKKTNLGQNFTIVDGHIFRGGQVILPRAGIKPVSKEDSLKEVRPTPAKEPQKRKRWRKGSFLTEQQAVDEQKQLDDHIA